MHLASFAGMAVGWKKGRFRGRLSTKGVGETTPFFSPKTSLSSVRIPKNVFWGVLRFTLVPLTLFKISSPSFCSNSPLARWEALPLILCIRTTKLSSLSMISSRDMERILSKISVTLASQMNNSVAQTLVIADLNMTDFILLTSASSRRT